MIFKSRSDFNLSMDKRGRAKLVVGTFILAYVLILLSINLFAGSSLPFVSAQGHAITIQASCDVGARQCSGTEIQVCNDTQAWEVFSDCSSGRNIGRCAEN